MRRDVTAFVLVLALLPSMVSSALAQGSTPAASLRDMAWLAGHWVGTTASGQHIVFPLKRAQP